MKLTIKELCVYPIKSCSVIVTNEFQIGEAGPEIRLSSGVLGDRQWMFVDEEGKFLTQRTLPQMALMKNSIQNGKFFLNIEGQDFEIPLSLKDAPRAQVSVWGKEVDAALVEGVLSQAASDFLKKPVRLVQFDQKSDRESLLKGRGLGVQTRFTDSQAYLVVTEESLKDLNSRLKNSIGANRFRANIVVSGADKAFSEDHWSALGNDKVIFEATKACARCKVITVDPMTGQIPDSEPLVALSKFRKKETAVYFGQYFLSRSFGETLKVGETLEAAVSASEPS